MLTVEQAINGQEFHFGICKRIIGPRGGVRIVRETWRRNGRTKTWKRAPHAFSIPVKHGMYTYGRISSGIGIGGWDASNFHVASDCPLNGKGVR